MRIVSLLIGLLLLVACSGSDDADSADDPAPPTGSASAPETSGPEPSATETASADACTLLTAAEAKEILGEPAKPAEASEMAGIPQCIWPAKTGTHWVQVASTDASAWSRSLPELFRQLEAGIPASDKANLKKLRKGVELVESGQELDSNEACSLFSEMLEVQGEPPSTESIVSAFPSADQAQALTAQVCSSGQYTSVTTTDPGGLEAPLPTEAVERAARRIHRAATQ